MEERHASSRFRTRVHEIIFEADTSAGKLFDVLLIISIVASVVLVMLDSVDSIRQSYGNLLYLGEWFWDLFSHWVCRFLISTKLISLKLKTLET